MKEVSEILDISNGKIYEIVKMSQISQIKVGSRGVFMKMLFENIWAQQISLLGSITDSVDV